MECPKCGTTNRDGAGFCYNCGKPLNAVTHPAGQHDADQPASTPASKPAPTAPSAAPAPASAASHGLPWGWLLAGVLAVFLILAVIYGINQNKALAGQQAAAGTDSNAPSNWPTTPGEAAAYFRPRDPNVPYAPASRWEKAGETGWHLIEAAEALDVYVRNGAGEGYRDTKPGKDPVQVVVAAGNTVKVQGMTIWQDTPENVFCAMIGQKYPGLSYDLVVDKVEAIGFAKPTTCK